MPRPTSRIVGWATSSPAATNYPLVYYVNLFYKILIPAVIGAMALFVGLDACAGS